MNPENEKKQRTAPPMPQDVPGEAWAAEWRQRRRPNYQANKAPGELPTSPDPRIVEPKTYPD